MTVSVELSPISVGTQTSLPYNELKIERMTSYRLFIDIMVFTLGLGTIISSFVILFLLSGLSMLNVPIIAVASVLVILGILFIGLGAYFVVSSVNSSLVGILRKQLAATEKEAQSLQKELERLRSIEVIQVSEL
ncbi:hypothetical protein [Chlamydia pecorum]|uniref:Uncharacterized protein n=1 Tax=Chlamydia pecorum (strain ATCC VR-628 / DSM 29919 / E58) TaxID=331635 RepID=A0AA34RDQ1_CHLPE|nr:hypothetical protein [Chlamydia pecorum]AEB41857.1 conserved hypothetical protein [Chlamydia pecorum E58]ETF37609.1 hypothetical protein CpecS_0803 [Chlamydia pecorum VR629]UFP06492.1 5-bromo-4-chloroindolyl phosphate hydrolysis family protein [Chlamydia pecorum]UJT77208.1 hypothetical protein NSWBovSBE_0819 [Chlamydia pecorum]